MADRGTVILVPEPPLLNLTNFAVHGMSLGTLVFNPGTSVGGTAPSVPTTGQIWPRGSLVR